MYISWFQIHSYKSFVHSDEIELDPGMNIILGQNDSGKTALLEALSLKFRNKPFRSLQSTANHRPQPDSNIHFNVRMQPQEFHDLLAQTKAESFMVNLPMTLSGRVSASTQGLLNNRNEQDLCVTLTAWFQGLDKYEISLIYNGNKADFELRQAASTIDTYDALSEDLKYRFNRTNTDQGVFYHASPIHSGDPQNITLALARAVAHRLYYFHAERLNLAKCKFGVHSENPVLLPNASNLAEMIHHLSSTNNFVHTQYCQLVTTIFPEICWVDAPLVDGNQSYEIFLTRHDAYHAGRTDLKISLADSGTGVGQVLAILFLLVTQRDPLIIIIDEPQTFLHPNAERKLIQTLKKFPQHQYLIATHSPTTITAAESNSYLLVSKVDGISTIRHTTIQDFGDLSELLCHCGSSIADMFGKADRILWVEGPSEVSSFPRILGWPASHHQEGHEIISVMHTGDLDSKKDQKKIIQIYRRLTEAAGIIPLTFAFIFDREDRSQAQLQELQTLSDGKIHFLQRRQFENYLLHPEALAAYVNGVCNDEVMVTPETVRDTFAEMRPQAKYCKPFDVPQDDERWLANVDGSLLLKDLLEKLTERRIHYKSHKEAISSSLTEWILDNDAAFLEPLRNELSMIFKSEKA